MLRNQGLVKGKNTRRKITVNIQHVSEVPRNYIENTKPIWYHITSYVPGTPEFVTKATKTTAHSEQFLIFPGMREIITTMKVVCFKKVFFAVLNGGTVLQ